jgi:hypothetical protein
MMAEAFPRELPAVREAAAYHWVLTSPSNMRPALLPPSVTGLEGRVRMADAW